MKRPQCLLDTEVDKLAGHRKRAATSVVNQSYSASSRCFLLTSQNIFGTRHMLVSRLLRGGRFGIDWHLEDFDPGFI
jgi:hypothetical protein